MPHTNTYMIYLQEHFNAPVEQVFDAWRNPRDLEHWAWGTVGNDVHAEVDFQVGGEFVISTARPEGKRWAFSGAYTEIQPNRRIAHTLVWDAPMGYDAVKESVTVEFTGHEGRTSVLFLHEGELSKASREEHTRGWRNVLQTLRRHIEVGDN